MSTQFAIPLIGAAVSTTASAPVTGTVNRYDATSGALAPTLPALSGVSAGASIVVQKTDSSANVVTITCAGADTFQDGSTTLALKTGDSRQLEVVTVSATKYWNAVGGIQTDTTGNAATATKLATARNINGVAFDGTAAITVADSTKEPSISAGTTSQYWRGDKTWQTLSTAATPTAVKTAAYTAVVNDLIPVDATSAAFTVTLPTAPADKSIIVLKKIDSSANAVTVAAGGSDVFNKASGSTTLSMSVLNQAVTLQYASSSGIWYSTVNAAPVSTLDGRYLATAATAAAATKLATARNINGVPFDGTGNISTNSGGWLPSDYGWLAWAYDLEATTTSAVGIGGTLQAVGIKIPVATTITNVILYVATAGATLTTNQCFAGLYQGGTLLAATADQSASWNSTGLKTMALTSAQSVSAGLVYVAFYSTGTTQPAVARTGSVSAINAGLSAGGFRHATANTGLTTALPGTMGTQVASTSTFWAAVS